MRRYVWNETEESIVVADDWVYNNVVTQNISLLLISKNAWALFN